MKVAVTSCNEHATQDSAHKKKKIPAQNDFMQMLFVMTEITDYLQILAEQQLVMDGCQYDYH